MHTCRQVLGDMPQKAFAFTRRAEANVPLALPDQATPEQALERVLRLPGVGSKRFLTTKVDRCVTGGGWTPLCMRWCRHCSGMEPPATPGGMLPASCDVKAVQCAACYHELQRDT